MENLNCYLKLFYNLAIYYFIEKNWYKHMNVTVIRNEMCIIQIVYKKSKLWYDIAFLERDYACCVGDLVLHEFPFFLQVVGQSLINNAVGGSKKVKPF